MRKGYKKDWAEFNCSQEHEFTYVKNLYTNPDAIYLWLKKACTEGILNHSKHAEVYTLLAKAGFTKK